MRDGYKCALMSGQSLETPIGLKRAHILRQAFRDACDPESRKASFWSSPIAIILTFVLV